MYAVSCLTDSPGRRLPRYRSVLETSASEITGVSALCYRFIVGKKITWIFRVNASSWKRFMVCVCPGEDGSAGTGDVQNSSTKNP